MLKLQNIWRSSQHASGILCRQQSTASPDQKIKEFCFRGENFGDLIARRRSEAFRSIMLEVNAKDIFGQVYNHCKQFGQIMNAFVYKLKDDRDLMLIEYESMDAVKEAFKFSGFQANRVKWPNRVLTVTNSKLNSSLSNDAPLQIGYAVEPPIAHILRNAATFDEQVRLLYEHSRLTDLSVRLRFLTALQAQVVINEFLDDMFPNAIVYPFGSSVNGFGKLGCDIDMALRFDKIIDNVDKNNDNPLEFRGKELKNDEDIKKLEGNQVKCIASLIEYLLPGCEGISAFSGARVPIVRYFDTNIHSSVDLSVNNLAGFQITECMYAMGLMDPRIRPFIFMVRRWASEFDVTNHSCRDNFTNFQLSYMCLSFLQQLKEPLIPTFEEVTSQIRNNEFQSPFINFDQVRFETKNTSTVLELFTQFLEYFESFNFNKYMITIRTTGKIAKPEPAPLYLENIFDSTNPWGGNVSNAECNTLQIMIREALQELEQCSITPSNREQNWGLLEILSKLK